MLKVKGKNANAKHGFLLRERGDAYSESNVSDYDRGTWIQNPLSGMPHRRSDSVSSLVTEQKTITNQ